MENLLLFFLAAAALVPISSLPAHQYHLVYEPKSWQEALRFCRDHYTDLAAIGDMDDVNILNDMADLEQMVYSPNSYQAWIGLHDEEWRWSMPDGDFRNWGSGEPGNYLNMEHCVGMTDQGLWVDVPCHRLYNPICSDRIGADATFVLISRTMNWSESQKHCREHHTDLATIRDLPENQKVKELVPEGKKVWIGLYRTSWEWVDGSSYRFQYWVSEEPKHTTNKCAAAFFESSGRWQDVNCESKRASICYQDPVSQEVFKVKLVRTSHLDLEDPAVLEHLLKQLKLKLREQGGDPKVKLSWRRRRDGKIFHQEDLDV